ncbi:MAG TPA: TonB-dependent receptor, partial [Steroidobacteraceae bacterium]|nr:TonB-dependent receptor [Steroidobacteraceae bacterium]
ISPFGAPVMNDAVNGHESRSFTGVTLRVEHSFSFGDLSSISAYRHFNTFNREDQDGTNRIYLYFDDANIEQNTSFSQEFTLSGKTTLADWVTGTTYYYDNAHQTSQINLYTNSIDTLATNTGNPPIYGLISAASEPLTGITLLGDPWQENMFNQGYSRAIAAYGDVIWHLAPAWNLTTGVRFTHDERDFSWYNPTRTATELDTSLNELNAVGFPLPPPQLFNFYQNLVFNAPVSTAAPYRVNNSWNDTSPRVVLDYKPRPDVMYYASFAQGYQAGGYNALEPGATYQPEKVKNYEVGVKSELLDRRLLVNASVYYFIYSNLQNLNLVPDSNGALPQYEVTVSDQHATGVDFETRWQATDAFSLKLIGTYIDLTYKDYVAPDGTDLSGQAVGQPLWALAGGFDYLWRDLLGGDLDLTVQNAFQGAARCNADSVATGGCFANGAFRVGTTQDRTDVRVAWTSRSVHPVTVALYANNLFDNQYATGIQTISASTLGTPFTNITPPRFWGAELGVHF